MTDEEKLATLGKIIQDAATRITAHDILIHDLMLLVYERTGMTREDALKWHERIRRRADEAPVDPLIADQVAGWIHQLLDELERTIRGSSRE